MDRYINGSHNPIVFLTLQKDMVKNVMLERKVSEKLLQFRDVVASRMKLR